MKVNYVFAAVGCGTLLGAITCDPATGQTSTPTRATLVSSPNTSTSGPEIPVANFLANINIIESPGSPGTLALLTSRAVPIIIGKSDGGTHAPVCAAANWVKGRVVAFAHSGYIDKGSLEHKDTGELMDRLTRWVGGGKRNITLGVAGGDGADWFKSRGYTVRKVTNEQLGQELSEYDAIVLGGLTINEKQRASLQRYITSGGGVIVAQTGWGWQQINARGGAEPDMRTNTINILLRPSGINFTDQFASDTTNDGFDVSAVAAGPLTLDESLSFLLNETPAEAPRDNETMKLNRARSAQASATASSALRLLPIDDTSARPRLAALRATHSKVPSNNDPVQIKDAVARLLITLEIDDLVATPAEQIRAHPAAAGFPGSVPSDASRVTQQQQVSMQQQGWQSTGLYAPAGEIVTIEVPEKAAGLTLRIGCHTDRLWHLRDWKRIPEISREFNLKPGKNTVASAFGGLVYIQTNKGAIGVEMLTISGAVRALWYRDGHTTTTDWQRQRETHLAPWGELTTPSVTISLPAAALRRLEDPAAIAQAWQQVLDFAADLKSIPRERTRGERYVPDLQISAGYMHSGYPIMTHMDAVDDMSLVDNLRSGAWGLFHELGHNHQESTWTFDGTTEVTCNLWSLYLMEKIANKPVSSGHDAIDSRDDRTRRMNKHIGTGADFKKWKSDPFLALEMYMQLREVFGWEPFTSVFAQYNTMPRSDEPTTDLARHDEWMKRMSKATGKNLSEFFTRWGVPISAQAIDAVKHLPVWMPDGMPESTKDAQPPVATP